MPKLDLDTVLEAVERASTSLDNPGFCKMCGTEHDSCEPDMRRGECDECGEMAVFGAEELLFYLF